MNVSLLTCKARLFAHSWCRISFVPKQVTVVRHDPRPFMSEAQRRIHGTYLLRRRCRAAHLLQAEQSSPASASRTRRQKSMTWSTGAHRFERLSTRCIMFSRKRDQWRFRKGSVTGCRDRQSLKVSHHTVASPRGHEDDCVRSSTP